MLELFPNTSLGISNDFVCEICTKAFGVGDRVKNHVRCLQGNETCTWKLNLKQSPTQDLVVQLFKMLSMP